MLHYVTSELYKNLTKNDVTLRTLTLIYSYLRGTLNKWYNAERKKKVTQNGLALTPFLARTQRH